MIAQTWITTNEAGELCRVYKAGDTYYTDDLPLRLCTPQELAAIQRPTPKQLIRRIAEYYNITLTELCGQSRAYKYSYPRHVCCYLLWTDYALPWEYIGALMNRDRSSIQRAHRIIGAMQNTHKHIESDLCNLRAKYQSPASLPC